MATIKLGDLKGKYYAEGEGDFDIVNKYPWTITPEHQRYNVPYIELVEYEQDIATLYAQLLYWYSNIKDMSSGGVTSGTNPYENLYHAKPTGVTFKLPYFETYDHMITQGWEKSKGLMDYPIAEKILKFAANAAKALQLSPGTFVNQPQIWSGAGLADYTVNLILFNTIPNGTSEYSIDIARNQRFKRRLQMSTLHDQQTAILASPPAIFSVRIPGIRYSPAAVIGQLTVSNLGQMNLIKGEVIPDAYQFTIMIKELITESRQILNDQIKTGGKIMVAISSDAPTDTQTENAIINLKPPTTDEEKRANINAMLGRDS